MIASSSSPRRSSSAGPGPGAADPARPGRPSRAPPGLPPARSPTSGRSSPRCPRSSPDAAHGRVERHLHDPAAARNTARVGGTSTRGSSPRCATWSASAAWRTTTSSASASSPASPVPATRAPSRPLLANSLPQHQHRPRALTTANIAVVRVEATIPAGRKPGQKVSVRVSSIGDAESLYGGILELTELTDITGQVARDRVEPGQHGRIHRLGRGRDGDQEPRDRRDDARRRDRSARRTSVISGTATSSGLEERTGDLREHRPHRGGDQRFVPRRGVGPAGRPDGAHVRAGRRPPGPDRGLPRQGARPGGRDGQPGARRDRRAHRHHRHGRGRAAAARLHPPRHDRRDGG